MTAAGDAPDQAAVPALYHALLDAWNRRSADDMAGLFEPAGQVVGFDGSSIAGPEAIRVEMGRIFANHPTAAYVGKVREVRLLAPGVGLLRAVAGMVPPGQADINPAVNAVQALVAVKHGNQWRIALYQNTPTQFHGRPELGVQLTEELRQLLRSSRSGTGGAT